MQATVAVLGNNVTIQIDAELYRAARLHLERIPNLLGNCDLAFAVDGGNHDGLIGFLLVKHCNTAK